MTDKGEPRYRCSLCLFVCKYTHVPQYMDTLEELVLSFCHVVPRERKEVIMLGSKCLHLLDRLAGPLTDF